MGRKGVYAQYLWSAALAGAVLGLGGCGGNERPKTIPISGRVLIDGSAPGEMGKLFFTPTQAAEGYVKRPASGSFDDQGNYRVMSWVADDGLVPGHYKINIVPGDPATTKIPKSYQDSSTSDLEVDVPIDKEKIEYDVKIVTH
jgi:hypothetical protein